MINALVVAMFVTVFSAEYLVRERGLLHPYCVLLPEVLSAIAMLVVVLRLMAGVRISLDRRYTAFLVLLGFVMMAGYVIQDVPTGPIVAGVRDHLKYVPFFLLPAVYRFSPAQLRAQLFVLLAILLAQTPLAVYQRFVEYANMMETGDPVRGTASTSSALSLLMVCAIAMLASLYFRRRIGLATFVVLGGLFFLPTTLNETKATLLLLPVALLVPALGMPRGSRALRRLVPVAAAGGLALVAFISAYNSLIQYRPNGQQLGRFISERNFAEYLYTGAAEGEGNYIGRFDSIEFAIRGIDDDPLTFAFGLGAGNVSMSFLPQFDGEHAAYYDRYGVNLTEVTSLLWQVGVVGLVAYLIFYALLLRDSRRLSRADEEADALLGQIWAAVMVIMTFGLIYKAVFSMNEVGYLFWYFSGVVAGRVVEQRRSRRAPSRFGETAFAGPARAAAPAFTQWRV